MNGIVAILGRPNVGKSTLFNRLVEKKKALVHHLPGTTRDRNEAKTIWKGKEFSLIDTGGWGDDVIPMLTQGIKRQMQDGLEVADLVLLVVDGIEGLHPLDKEIANVVRRQKKTLLVVVNKIDNAARQAQLHEFHTLGFKEILGVSALHGSNTPELIEWIEDHLPPPSDTEGEPEDGAIHVTLVGKPNAGKSSLFNYLAKQPRAIVSEMPGTTRESIDTQIVRGDDIFVVTDTPGLYRRHRFKDDMEYLSTLSAQRALERTNVAVLLIDASQGIGETDAKIAQMVIDRRCACLVAINKWDLIENKETEVKRFKEEFERKLQFLPWAAIMYISAKTGQRAEKLLDMIKTVYAEYGKEVPADDFTRLIHHAQMRKPLTHQGKVLRIMTSRQIKTCPPVFEFVVNNRELAHFSYRRYIENSIRREFGFDGTPMVLNFRDGRQRERRI